MALCKGHPIHKLVIRLYYEINTFIFTGVVGQPNTMLQITSPNGPNIKSEVIAVDPINKLVTIKDSPWLTYMNVAYAYANTGNTQINITQVTNSYNIVNNGVYSNTAYPLMDIVFAGDKVQLSGNTYIVSSVDYIHGIIHLTTSILSNTSNGLQRSAASDHYVDIVGVTGSIPVAPTIFK